MIFQSILLTRAVPLCMRRADTEECWAGDSHAVDGRARVLVDPVPELVEGNGAVPGEGPEHPGQPQEHSHVLFCAHEVKR